MDNLNDYSLYDYDTADMLDQAPPKWLVQASLDAGDTGAVRVSCWKEGGVITYALGDGDGTQTWTRTVYAQT